MKTPLLFRFLKLADSYPITRLSEKVDNLLKISSKSKSTKNELPYTVELITQNDEEEVLNVLRNFFFKDEPLTASLKIGLDCKEQETFSMKYIPENVSFKAVLKTNRKIIGVFLNGLVQKRPANAPIIRDAEKYNHEKFKKILQILDHVTENFDVFAIYPQHNIALEGKIIAVDTNYRGMNVAVELTKRTLEYMREHNISVFFVICSSLYSAKVMEKLGLKNHYELAYADFKDENGQQLLTPAEPHKSIIVMVKYLDNLPKESETQCIKNA